MFEKEKSPNILTHALIVALCGFHEGNGTPVQTHTVECWESSQPDKIFLHWHRRRRGILRSCLRCVNMRYWLVKTWEAVAFVAVLLSFR